jgi:hypothetical protein
VALAGDAAAFTLGSMRDLIKAEDDMAMERRRIRISERAERRQQRAAIADITGIDPKTGQPTAIARDRAEDNALAREKEARQAREAKNGGKGKGGITAGQRTKHQGIVGDIQDARERAKDARRLGVTWRQVELGLRSPRSEDNPYGGHGPMVSRAAVELARTGRISASTMRALKSRGLLPRRAPSGWRRSGSSSRGGHPSRGANPGSVSR